MINNQCPQKRDNPIGRQHDFLLSGGEIVAAERLELAAQV
jgi:hypothetical protein